MDDETRKALQGLEEHTYEERQRILFGDRRTLVLIFGDMPKTARMSNIMKSITAEAPEVVKPQHKAARGSTLHLTTRSMVRESIGLHPILSITFPDHVMERDLSIRDLLKEEERLAAGSHIYDQWFATEDAMYQAHRTLFAQVKLLNPGCGNPFIVDVRHEHRHYFPSQQGRQMTYVHFALQGLPFPDPRP